MKTNNLVKLVITFMIVAFPFSNSNSQFIISTEIIPKNPTNIDEILIADSVEFLIGYQTTCPPLVGSYSNLYDSILELNLFFDISGYWPQVGCVSVDTSNISYLNTGLYTLFVKTNTIDDLDTTFNIDIEILEFNIINSSSIFENKFYDLIIIYPVPTEKILFLETPKRLKIKMLTLINLQGKRIMEFDPKLRELNLCGLYSGLYFLNILTDKGSVKKKVLIK